MTYYTVAVSKIWCMYILHDNLHFAEDFAKFLHKAPSWIFDWVLNTHLEAKFQSAQTSTLKFAGK